MVTRSKTARKQIIEMTEDRLLPTIENVYKESLRSMINVFGNLYYIDGNSNRIKVTCSHGNPERIIGRIKADNTMVLPFISIVETGTSNDDDKRRYQPMLHHEVMWDPEKLRAVRVLSLVPRPIVLSYEITIWSKYKADLDMLRSSIFSKFNPDLDIVTPRSTINKAFIENESEVGSFTAEDSQDRVLQKSIAVNLETYIENPKFTFTNTGQVVEFDC
jgi:hypothetical protein